jgi:hypothetical protein
LKLSGAVKPKRLEPVENIMFTLKDTPIYVKLISSLPKLEIAKELIPEKASGSKTSLNSNNLP